MRQTNENTSVNLKLVMLFDWRKQIYCICSHNLPPEDASREVTELRRNGLPAFTVDHRSRHLQDDAEECEACRADSPAVRQSTACSGTQEAGIPALVSTSEHKRNHELIPTSIQEPNKHARIGGTSCQMTATATRIMSS